MSSAGTREPPPDPPNCWAAASSSGKPLVGSFVLSLLSIASLGDVVEMARQAPRFRGFGLMASDTVEGPQCDLAVGRMSLRQRTVCLRVDILFLLRLSRSRRTNQRRAEIRSVPRVDSQTVDSIEWGIGVVGMIANAKPGMPSRVAGG